VWCGGLTVDATVRTVRAAALLDGAVHLDVRHQQGVRVEALHL
jgi:hypothetical protein